MLRVWRCPLWVPRQPSGLKRVLHLASFAISSLLLLLWQGVWWQPDVVFVVEPPFSCAVGALLVSRLSGAKSWLHIQDFEIDAGFDLGLLPTSGLMRSAIVALEHWLMRRFDRVSSICSSMVKRLKTKGVDAAKCVDFPNWVDTHSIYPLPEASGLRAELAIAPNTVVALYAGSMGEKQGLEVLIAAAQMVATHRSLLFVLCGEGAAKKRLVELAAGLPNLRFLNLQPVERLNALLNLADIHLLPQIANAADLVMPSKLKGMCASGRPVIATADLGTQLAFVVQKCGIVVPPGNVTALGEAIVYLATHPEVCTQFGQAARNFAVTHWHQETLLRQIEQKLVELCSSAHPDVIDTTTLGSSVVSDTQENHLSAIQTQPIGSYLVEAGLITQLQVDSALAQQRLTGLRLGEIIVEQGWLNQQIIDEVMNKAISLQSHG